MSHSPSNCSTTDPDAAARHVVEAAIAQWHRHSSSRLDVPVSLLAVLALSTPPRQHRGEFIETVSSISGQEFVVAARDRWHLQLLQRPDLATPLWPLLRPWEPSGTDGALPVDEPELDAALAMARAAVRAGLWDITGGERRHATDLLGLALTELRTPKARQGLGQFYTPAPAAEMMAQLAGMSERRSVHDPCCGTGGMFRAAAAVMRRQGLDPTTMTWVGVDIDEIAIAACAANAILWDLGPQVVLGVGNSITDLDVIERATRQREETIGLAGAARAVDAIGLLLDGIDSETPEPAAGGESVDERA